MSNALPRTFGLPPQNATEQNTFAIGIDTAFFAPATSITSQNFFDSSRNVQRPYRTSVLTVLAQQKGVVITALSLMSNLELAALEVGATVAKDLQVFYQYSYIDITILGKKEDSIPLTDLLPYYITNYNGTVANPLKFSPLFFLPSPIEVPAGGDIQFTLNPVAGYTTAAAAATNPHYPGANQNLASDRGFGLALQYYGSQIRPMA